MKERLEISIKHFTVSSDRFKQVRNETNCDTSTSIERYNGVLRTKHGYTPKLQLTSLW